ncbi:MAG: cobalamin transport system ATP-binding protein [Chloroflexota bacterium]|nr:cobalamin transport system ATP-binding protein [Chloroflexota bacterium]
MSILRAQALSLGYPNKNVIEDFSAAVEKGHLLGLVGPNGSGKTTLLRAFCGLIQPNDGQVYLEERSLTSIPSRQRAQAIGWVPQREGVTWPLSVREVVNLGRAPHRGWLLPMTRADHAVVEGAMRFTELEALQERRVDELSGGEFQRVLIARALAQEPRVLLLDEPTANLDIHYQIQVMDLVRQLVTRQGITAVMAVHDLNLAARYCDQLILLKDGRQVCTGSPLEVLTPDNLAAVFHVKTHLYQDPWGFWAVSARNGVEAYGSK